jgi:hypothetical protein
MEHQPDLYSIEHGEKDHIERKLKTLDTSPAIDKQEELREARLALIGNDRVYQKFFDAIRDVQSFDASKFSSIENLFIEYCINLSDDEVEALVRQFNLGLSEYARNNTGSIPPQHRDPEKIRQMKLNPRGILSVLEFIRARKTLLELDPATEYTFTTEDDLDARYKIDIIEYIYDTSDGNRNIDTMNLIQVKSSEPRDSEKHKILDGHRSWINSSVMDFEAFRREYTNGIPDRLTLNEITENIEVLSFILQDICTDQNGFKPENFLTKLDLEKMTNKHKAWILSEYMPSIKAGIKRTVENGEISAEDADEIIRVLEELLAKVYSKGRLPRNISRVRSVNSIIAIGQRIISTTSIKSKPANSDHELVMKYN